VVQAATSLALCGAVDPVAERLHASAASLVGDVPVAVRLVVVEVERAT
jgi:hypothetical protein